MNLNKKTILDQFQQYLISSYKEYCSKHNTTDDAMRLITYIIDQGLISSAVIKRYTIIREFNHEFAQNKQSKTAIVNNLADRFHISERSIWNILKQGDISK